MYLLEYARFYGGLSKDHTRMKILRKLIFCVLVDIDLTSIFE